MKRRFWISSASGATVVVSNLGSCAGNTRGLRIAEPFGLAIAGGGAVMASGEVTVVNIC